MEFPRNCTADQLRDWLLTEYGEATAETFKEWKPRQMFGACEASLKEIGGTSIGARLFGDMNA